MLLSKKIDIIVSQKSLLKHPFYQKWNEGELTLGALRGYSKEYFLLVKTIPFLVSKIANFADEQHLQQIYENLKDEISHIPLWEHFASALGVTPKQLEEHSGLPKTLSAIENFSNLVTSLNTGAVAMYAFEKEIPTISQTKIEGLVKFYNFSEDNSVEYFKRHITDDIRHCETWKSILDELPLSDHGELTQVAESTLNALNLLLDACYETYC